jgi:endonuclease/exonuclease/phosphatase family metal-dependent hydrolase
MVSGGGRWKRCLLLALWCCAVISHVFAERLTVMTYNVENYLSTNRMVDGQYLTDYPKPEKAKTALRAVIRSAGADVIALQEMGTLPYLKELQRDLASEGCEYPHFELLEAADDERHIGILSKKPLTQAKKYTALRFRYFDGDAPVKRGLLSIRIEAEGGAITLFLVHLKSRFTDRSDDYMSGVRRAGEATAIRDQILRDFPEPENARLVVLGDFNDVPTSRALRALHQRGQKVIAQVLPAFDSRRETWTHYYRKEDAYSRVDYILVSPALLKCVPAHEARIVDQPEVSLASDHRPIVVTFETAAR